jgi:hypothetical protein
MVTLSNYEQDRDRDKLLADMYSIKITQLRKLIRLENINLKDFPTDYDESVQVDLNKARLLLGERGTPTNGNGNGNGNSGLGTGYTEATKPQTNDAVPQRDDSVVNELPIPVDTFNSDKKTPEELVDNAVSKTNQAIADQVKRVAEEKAKALLEKQKAHNASVLTMLQGTSHKTLRDMLADLIKRRDAIKKRSNAMRIKTFIRDVDTINEQLDNEQYQKSLLVVRPPTTSLENLTQNSPIIKEAEKRRLKAKMQRQANKAKKDSSFSTNNEFINY